MKKVLLLYQDEVPAEGAVVPGAALLKLEANK